MRNCVAVLSCLFLTNLTQPLGRFFQPPALWQSLKPPSADNRSHANKPSLKVVRSKLIEKQIIL